MIVYVSRTGNIKHIVNNKLKDLKSTELKDDMVVNQPYFLFTYTDRLGEVPIEVLNFLENHDNITNLKGVIASGNTNFGKEYFCKSANIISDMYNVPIIRKLDLRGFTADYEDIYYKYNMMIGGN